VRLMPPFARALSVLHRKRTYGDIGLELSLEELHMVQLCRRGEGLEVNAHAAVAYPTDAAALLEDPGQFSRLIKQSLKQGKFVGRRVVAAMPASSTQVMPVSYQSSGEGGNDAAIAQLMRERIGDGIAEFVIDYMPVQTLYTGREKLALVAICREETVVNFLELLRKSGLSVTALEIGPIAIRRLIASLQAVGAPQNTLVVNCGRNKSYLTLMSDTRLLADDEVDFGEETVLEKICKTLDMPRELAVDLVHKVSLDPALKELDPELARNADALTGIVKPELGRLVQEIQRGLVFAASESRGARADQVYLLGSMARWPGMAELLASLADTPVATVPSPLTLFPSMDGAQRNESAPELAVATGLALRGFMDPVLVDV
jgi:type IV pilus assembly protein PilM